MLRSSKAISRAAPWRATSTPFICCSCAARSKLSTLQSRPFSATESLQKRTKSSKKAPKNLKHDPAVEIRFFGSDTPSTSTNERIQEAASRNPNTKQRKEFISNNEELQEEASNNPEAKRKREAKKPAESGDEIKRPVLMSLKDALLGTGTKDKATDLKIEYATPEDFAFEPVEIDMPAVPMSNPLS